MKTVLLVDPADESGHVTRQYGDHDLEYQEADEDERRGAAMLLGEAEGPLPVAVLILLLIFGIINYGRNLSAEGIVMSYQEATMSILRFEKSFRSTQWLILLLGLVFVSGIAACSKDDNSTQPPDVIPLPAGFRPEGVAISGTSLFIGSIPSGRVFKADITTGQGQVFIDPAAGRSAIGLKADDRGRLFVAGGATGQAYVYDAGTGADIAVYSQATGTTFINDVTLAPDAAWFTDSRNPVLYKLPIGSDGALGAQATVTPLPLTGDFVFVDGQTNANGIAATPDGATLIIVQSVTGKLFTVNPASGATREISLGAESVANGDGILLQGLTLYVVQNRLNQVAVIALSADLTSGTVTARAGSPVLDVPTTVAASDGSLYLPNARFGIADPDTADYAVVRIDKP